MPRTRYPILQEFISGFGHKFTQKLRVQWSPRLPSLKSVNDKWRELRSEMRLEPPKLTTQDGAIGISWSILEVVKFIQRHKVLHSAWDTSMPLTLIVRRDAFPVAGTQWSQLSITFANRDQLARNLSHQFIIGVAYCDDKDATILANLWESNIKVCVTMRPSWLFTSDCSIDELNFQLVQLNITTYNAPSSLSSCCKLSLTVQHLSGSRRRSFAKSGSGVIGIIGILGETLQYIFLYFFVPIIARNETRWAQCTNQKIVDAVYAWFDADDSESEDEVEDWV